MAKKKIETLLSEYRKDRANRENRENRKPVRLVFNKVEGYDIYNPTASFVYNDEKVLYARVEKRDSENSTVMLFKETEKDIYEPADWIPSYELQDPCITRIGDYYILGGTKVIWDSLNADQMIWRTVFYYGKELESMIMLAEGPVGMKDIRLIGLKDGRVGIFTRPQGEKGGRGKIGFTTVNSLQEINEQVISEAPLLDLFYPEEWGGVNEAFLLPDENIGVLGHIACFEPDEVRHYYPIFFVLNPLDGTYTMPKILAERSDFLPGPSKRPDLEDVLFSGGLLVKGEDAVLYVGVSDCEVQYMIINNPFYNKI